MVIKMKRAISLFLAALTAVSMTAACGNKTNSDDKSENKTGVTSTEAVDNENGTETTEQTETAEQPSLNVDGAADEVDMGKVDGTKLDDTAAEDSSLEAKGDIANCEVTIDDAKLIDYTDAISGEQMKVVVVSFKFKNNNSTAQSFDGLLSVEATQGGNNLRQTLVAGVEGVNANSAISSVESNDTITVQKTYKLNDETTDINITVYKYGESSGASVSKAFKLS